MQHPAPLACQAVAADGEHDAHAALVHAAARGDEAAWTALVQRFAGLVWETVRAYPLPAATAASAAHMTWLRLTQNLGQMPSPGHVGEWLEAAAHQESRRAVRLHDRAAKEPLSAYGDHHE